MCILNQGRFGHSHGYNGAGVGDFCMNWHDSQSSTFLSICASMFGHHIILLVIRLIHSIPGCPSSSSFYTCSRPAWEIITSISQCYALILDAEFSDSFTSVGHHQEFGLLVELLTELWIKLGPCLSIFYLLGIHRNSV